MSHRKYCSLCGGKLRLASACLSLWAVLAFFSCLPLAYYVLLPVHSPPTACNDSGPGPSDVVIVARDSRSRDDDSCTLEDAASELENLVLCEQAAPEVDYPVLAVAWSEPPPAFSKFKLQALPSRAPPTLL